MNKEVSKNIIDELVPMFEATDAALDSWTGDGNLQFPVLLGMIAVQFNWNEKQVREADPLIRMYVRRHPDWHVTRGAHGGIMKSSDKQKKDADKLAKEVAKKQVMDAIEAKVSAAATTSDSE